VAPAPPIGGITIIGAGRMGAEISLDYAIGGHPVVLVGRTEEGLKDARRRIEASAAVHAEQGLISVEQCNGILASIDTTVDLDRAVEGADLIVESIAEDITAKTDLFRRVSTVNRSATLATNTSSLSIAELGAAAALPDRIIGTHYWNPPSFMPLVEVVPGPATDVERVRTVIDLLGSMGKEPIIAPDISGFLWNRLQLAILREAVWLVREGHTTSEAVDRIFERGLGRRWGVIGPFASMASGGQATVARVAELVLPTLSNDVTGDDFRALHLPGGAALSTATERRNRQLARLLAGDRLERREEEA
jgi:3-hydroxybutyryl-CoA dehydrogenase